MYDRDGPFGANIEMWVMIKLQYITSNYPIANVFREYIEENWWHKIYMWVWNLPYIGQNTNATTESYHGTLKAMLQSKENILVSHHVDWCIHELIGDVLTQYWCQSLHKNFGIVNNKCQQLFVVGALLETWLILDTNLTLPFYEGGPALIQKNPSTIHHPQPNYITMGKL